MALAVAGGAVVVSSARPAFAASGTLLAAIVGAAALVSPISRKALER